MNLFFAKKRKKYIENVEKIHKIIDCQDKNDMLVDQKIVTIEYTQ